MNREGILWFAERLNLQVVTPNAGNIHVSCPLSPYSTSHKSLIDRKPSMGIEVRERGVSSVHCFACGFGGTLSHLMHRMLKEDVDRNFYLKLLDEIEKREEEDIEYLAEQIGEYEETVEEEEDVMDERVIRPWMKRTHKSLLGRGVSVDTLRIWECGYDRPYRKLIFPVRNYRGELVGYVRGSVDGSFPKYANEGFRKGKYLYGENLVEEGASLVVVEGVVDALQVWAALKEAKLLQQFSVVALLGALATRDQAKKILEFTDEVIYFLDNDIAGKDGMFQTSKKLYRTGIVQKRVDYPLMYAEGDPDMLVRSGVDVVSLIQGATLLIG